MSGVRYAWLVVQAWVALVAHDAIYAWSGFDGVTRRLAPPADVTTTTAQVQAAVCDAVLLASCLYWRPVRCLQRSVCTVALLRRQGIRARLVIGYRAVPFFSHAWVEVDGRVVNDSGAYQKRLRVLYAA
jgi:hypothetical protein